MFEEMQGSKREFEEEFLFSETIDTRKGSQSYLKINLFLKKSKNKLARTSLLSPENENEKKKVEKGLKLKIVIKVVQLGRLEVQPLLRIHP